MNYKVFYMQTWEHKTTVQKQTWLQWGSWVPYTFCLATYSVGLKTEHWILDILYI